MKFLLVLFSVVVATFQVQADVQSDVNQAGLECAKQFEGEVYKNMAEDDQRNCLTKCIYDKAGVTDSNGKFDMGKLEDLNGGPFTPQQKAKIAECHRDPRFKGTCEHHMCRQVHLTALCIREVQRS